MRHAGLVRGKECVVPLVRVLGFWEDGLQLSVDGVGHLLGEWLRWLVQGFAETESLDVDGCIGGVNGVRSREALLGKSELVCIVS